MAGSIQSKFLQLDRLGYKWKGERYPRVTTIKSKKSTGNALVDWAARMVDEEVKRIVTAYRAKQMDETEFLVRLMSDELKNAHNTIRDEAADFGTVFHALLENYAAGDQDVLHVAERELHRAIETAAFQLAHKREPKADLELRTWVQSNPLTAAKEAAAERLWPDVQAFVDWHDAAKPTFVRNEFIVLNRSPRYAGGCDGDMEIGNELVRFDLKTSKGVYVDYRLQLAAYRYADWMLDLETGDEIPNPPVDRTAILHVRDGQCVLLDAPTPKAVHDDFLACAQLYWSDREAPKEFEPFHPALPNLSIAKPTTAAQEAALA